MASTDANPFADPNFGKQGADENPFSNPDFGKPSGAIRRIADQGIKLAQGVVGVPEAAVGVADLVTGGRAGKLAESAGVRFKDAKAIMGEYLSPEQKAADQEVAQAEGFLPTVGAMVRNPSTIAGSVMESAPSMIGGGAAARGLLKVAPKLGAIAAGAAGEGLVSAGQNAEQVRQESATGLLTPEQSSVLAASGAMTGGISLASGKLANKLGIGDVQTMLASGKLGPVGAEATAEAAKKGVIRKLGEGVLNEGVLQELPQSYQEQVAQNIAQGKPWDEGAAKAGAQGMLAGAAMGGGANVVSHVGERAPETAPVPEPTPEPAPPALQIGNTPDPYLSFPDGTVARRSEIDAYINGLPADQQPAARAKMMGLAPQPAAPEPAPIKPSEAMGLDPAAGPMSAAAVTAVDTGAHQEIQLQQASEADQAAYEQATAEQEQKVSAPKPTPAAHEYSPYADANGDIVGMDQQPFRTFREALIQRQFENKAAGRNDFEAIKTGENQFVVRRVRYPEKQSNGPSTEVQPGDTGSTGVRSTDSPASVGVGATDGNGVGAQPRRSPDAVLDQAGELPKRTDAAPVAAGRAQPTTLSAQTTATAGPGFTAKDVTRVQNAAPRADTTPAAPAVEAPAVVAGDAATSEGVPNAGSAKVESGGVAPTEPALRHPLPVKRSKNGYAEIKLNGKKHFVTPFDDHFVIRNPLGAIAKSDNKPLQFASEADAIAYAANTTKPQEQPSAKTPEAITPTPQREAQAPDASQRLTPAQAGNLQEAHKAHGLDVTLQTVQKMHDRVMKSLITGKGSNGGVEYNIKPKERKELQAQADRLANDLSLFGVQQEAATPAPVAQSGLERMRAAHKAKNAKPVEPVEQPTPPVEQPAQASSSRPGEPSAEQIKSVKDITLTKKVGDSVVKKTSNASKAMKAINERADALEMVRKCLA